MTTWSIEEVPDADTLYYRVHVDRIAAQGGHLAPNVIRADPSGLLSTDWSRYSTIEESRDRGKQPDKNGVVGFPVKAVRAVEPLAVEHAPLPDNRSHTHIKGFRQPVSKEEQRQLKTRLRHELFACIEGGTWLLRPDNLPAP